MTPSTSLNAPNASGLSAAEHLAAARTAQQTGNDAAALRSLNAALALAPLNPEANTAKAALLAKHGKLTAALALQQAAVLQQPDNTEALWLYARYLTQAGHITLALAAMYRCAQLRPQDATPKRYLAALRHVKWRIPSAVQSR
jgi:Flp pilus assembly protein TadD